MSGHREGDSPASVRIGRAPRARRPALLSSAAAAATALLSGCAWFSPDAGMALVADVAEQGLRKDVAAIRTPETAELVRAEVRRLLQRALTADRAVQIALLNNRGLQAAYNELGIAEAAMVAASLPPNPTFSVERLSGPLEIEIEKMLDGLHMPPSLPPTLESLNAG